MFKVRGHATGSPRTLEKNTERAGRVLPNYVCTSLSQKRVREGVVPYDFASVINNNSRSRSAIE